MAHRARTSQKLPLAALVACLLVGAASAQSTVLVPLPLARPANAPQPGMVGAVKPAKPVLPLRGMQVSEPALPPTPFTNPFATLLGKPANGPTLDDKQRAIVARVNAYLSNTQQLSGKFVQIGPDGSRSQGDFFILKPGRVRFEYDPPSVIAVIADGQTIAVRDQRLATQDIISLSQTPLRFLLADRVDLMKDAHLIAVSADDVFVTVVLEEKNGMVGTSRLMMMFGATDMQLKQWTVTDPQGYDTTVAVYNLDTTKKPDPSLFKIDFTNYHN
jgi:outer membrane lipoprotein-sorting protein